MKITPKKYAQALAMMMDANADRTVIANFLKLLKQRRQLKLLPKIVSAFQQEWLKRKGITRIDIVYPEKFEESLREFEQQLHRMLGDKLHISASPSESLIGGMQCRIEDTLIDASIASNLKALAARLQK